MAAPLMVPEGSLCPLRFIELGTSGRSWPPAPGTGPSGGWSPCAWSFLLPLSSLLPESLLQARLKTSMVAEFQTQSAPGPAQPLQHPRLAKLGKTFLYLGHALPYLCSNRRKVRMLLAEMLLINGGDLLPLFKVQGLNVGG